MNDRSEEVPYQYGTSASERSSSPKAQASQQLLFALWPSRLAAFMIDLLIIWSAPVGLALYAVATGEPASSPGGDTIAPTTAGTIAIFIGCAVMIGLWVWNRVVRQGATGQSVGKAVLKIRVIMAGTNQSIGPGKSLLRDLCHIFDAPAYVGFVWPLWDRHSQTFSDKIVRTYVVQA